MNLHYFGHWAIETKSLKKHITTPNCSHQRNLSLAQQATSLMQTYLLSKGSLSVSITHGEPGLSTESPEVKGQSFKRNPASFKKQAILEFHAEKATWAASRCTTVFHVSLHYAWILEAGVHNH